MKREYAYNLHCHSHYSNMRFLDSMNTVKGLIKNAKAKGLAGIGLTDHGVLSGHVKVAKLMDQHPEFFNGKDGKGTFRVTLGEEIYLDDKSIIDDARKNNKKTKFFHFVLNAKDDIGYHALRIISTKSWQTSFFFRGMRRLPTYKDWLSKLMNNPKYHFKGHLIASTACLGSELSQSIVNNNKPRAKKFIKYIEDTFGKNQCYFEMMPAHRESQEKVNHALWNISHGQGYFNDGTGKGIPCIISTDAHYIDKNDRQAHSIFLKSESPGRDVKDFYYYAHLFTYDELKDYFPQNVLDTACENSLQLLKRFAPIWHKTNQDKMKDRKDHPIRMYYLQEIPDVPMPKHLPRINLEKYAKKYNINWDKYPYFKLFVNSKYPEDQMYMLHLFRGIHKRHIPFTPVYLKEINWELMTLHQLTLHFHEPMSSYFNTILSEVVKSIWNCPPTFENKNQKKHLLSMARTNPVVKQRLDMASGSLLGPGRGSAGEWVTSYIIGITQVNSVKWKLWAPRFECKSRADSGSMPDIDLDSQSFYRTNIIQYLKEHRGYNKVLNFSTFNTQAAKSTIYTACRGLGISFIQARNIANLLPADARGMGNISIHDALYGNKKKNIKPAKSFINTVKRYPHLKEALLGISQKIRGNSEHASGVAVFNEPYTQRNAMMKTNKKPGIPITQFSAPDSAYLSSLKYDYLTLTALDRIREAVHLLLRDHKIKWLGNLHDTYLHYFGSQHLDFTSPKMYDMLYKGEIPNAFEFNSLVGRRALLTVQAHDFPALVATNALMRLSVPHGEQPIDRFVRYMHHPQEWDQDMKKYGLKPSEMKVMHHYLDRHHGVCYSQEDLMKISMDKHISGFPYKKANTLRKAVAKKDAKIFAKAKKEFYQGGKQQHTRKAFLDYVWNECAVPARNYSFNLAHGVAYTIILIIEMNICYRFGAIYWQTACLSVNAGMYGDNVEGFKNPDYNKLCHALANKNIASKLIPPSINHSSYGFIPYHNHILYGLYPISNVSAKVATKIIKNRPYKSFDDFLRKTKLHIRQNIQLIKSGCFDEFNHDSNVSPTQYRYQLMKKYVALADPLKKYLTMMQVPKLKAHIPSKYGQMVKAYMFRQKIYGRKKQPMSPAIKQEFLKHYAKPVAPYSQQAQMSLLNTDSGKPYSTKNGHFSINIKAFNKWYNHFVRPLKHWLRTTPALEAEANNRRRGLWNKYCYGNPQAWEMNALGCYIGQHELQTTKLAKQFNVTPYNQVLKYNDFKKLNFGKPQTIYGTVIGKNANKHLVYLLTPEGIANVRVSRNKYAIFNKRNKKIKDSGAAVTDNKQLQQFYNKIVKGSWFSRGITLLCRGNRLGDNFFIDWNEKTYPLYIIIGYGKHADVFDHHGEEASNKVKFNPKSPYMQHQKQVKRDEKTKQNKLAIKKSKQQLSQMGQKSTIKLDKQADQQKNNKQEQQKVSSHSKDKSKKPHKSRFLQYWERPQNTTRVELVCQGLTAKFSLETYQECLARHCLNSYQVHYAQQRIPKLQKKIGQLEIAFEKARLQCKKEFIQKLI